MKITFVRPSMAGRQTADSLKPLAIMILASLTPKDIKIEFFDERIEPLPKYIDGDVLCFSVDTFSARRAYLLSKKYKKLNPNLKIIMGGFHTTACPDESIRFADSIIIGDAEPVWRQVIKDLKKNKLKPKYISSNSYILPFTKMRNSIFKNKKYAKVGIIQWKRGCVFNCNFCSINAFYKDNIIERSIDDVINEIKNTKEKLLFIADDNLLHDKQKLKQFLLQLIPLKKKWICQISINVANDEEILRLISKSGCIVMIIGFETLNKDNLINIGKKQNIKNKDYDKAINKIYSYGIMIYATFIFGYPKDKLNTFDEVYNFAMKHKFFIVNFNPLMAMPATDLYYELKSKGKLVDERWWLSKDYKYGDSMIYPDNFSPKQLSDNCKRIRYKYYSFLDILKRALNPINFKHLDIYLLINIISAFEIRKKQNLKLGGFKKNK